MLRFPRFQYCIEVQQPAAARRTRGGLCVVLMIVVASCGGAHSRFESDDTCHPIPVTTLRVNEHFLYIEPLAVAESHGSLLIAGTPSYLHHQDGTVHKDSLFGAVVMNNGDVVPIPKPIAGNIVGHRAHSLPHGGWRVSFSTPVPGEDFPVIAESIWLADLVDHAWRDVLQLGSPPHEIDRVFANSAMLLRHGDSTSLVHAVSSQRGWGLLVRDAAAEGYREEFIVTPMFGYAAAAHSSYQEHGLLQVLISRPGIARGDGQSVAEFHERRRGIWSVQKPYRDSLPIHDPVMIASRHGTYAGGIVFEGPIDFSKPGLAVGGIVESGQPVALDDGAFQLRGLLSGDSAVVWVIESTHGASGGIQRSLKTVMQTPRAVTTIGQYPSPFSGPFAIADVQPHAITVVGSVAVDGSALPITTAVVRLPLSCRPAEN